MKGISVRVVAPGSPTRMQSAVLTRGWDCHRKLAEYKVTNSWHLRAALSELRLNIRPKPGSLDVSHGLAEAADSKHHLLLRSSWDLPRDFKFDATFRYISRVENATVPAPGYGELDLRLAWQPVSDVEFAIVGQNLLHDHHPELGNIAVRQEMERSVYGKIVWRY